MTAPRGIPTRRRFHTDWHYMAAFQGEKHR
jgi:hypothetical protein